MSNFVAHWLKISLVVIVGCGFLSMMIYAFINRDEISSSQIEPPLIEAPVEPLKRRPDQPGGLQIPNRDKLVFDLLDGEGATFENAPIEVEQQPAVAKVDVVPVVETVQIVSEVKPAVAELAKAEPVVAKPVEQPKIDAKPVVKVVEAEPAKAVEKPTSGKWGVQLAAVNSIADGNAFAAKAQKDFAILKGLTPKISPVPGSKKYRVQLYGLKDRDAAVSTCSKLAGKQACFPVGG